jgi:hypothetical protein
VRRYVVSTARRAAAVRYTPYPPAAAAQLLLPVAVERLAKLNYYQMNRLPTFEIGTGGPQNHLNNIDLLVRCVEFSAHCVRDQIII